MRDETLSVMLGYTSIACWLGAQFPQIVVNWQRKSVDGLALPFLVNWFFGDATNLIGCLLTDQLPFQTYVATYFVFVDFCLVTQYFYYDAPKDARALSALRTRSRTSSLIRPSSFSYSQTHTLPRTNLSRSRSRSYSMDPHLRAAVAGASRATADLEATYTGSHASEVDAGGSHTRWRSLGTQRAGSLEGLPESVVADSHFREWEERRRLASLERRESDTGDDAVDVESESMMDSLYSEGGRQGRGRGKRVSWSPSQDRNGRRLSNEMHLHESQPATSTSSSVPASTVRGRQLVRPTIQDTQVVDELSSAPLDGVPRARTISTGSSVSASASRRSAGIVFLGMFALIGLSNRAGYRFRKDVQGRVLTKPQSIAPIVPWDVLPSADTSSDAVFLTFEAVQPHASSNATQHLIGRISAWVCTTLYLTSRLPQIWKNFVRKSVEGLSMYLFVFAFLGNLFYVLSILASPKMGLPAEQAAQFLRTSIPYLLGSGGTLIFDVTIVVQSFIYPKPSHIRRRRKSLVDASADEERGLLAAGAEN